MRPLAPLLLCLLGTSATACAYDSSATAGRVPNPVALGPVTQIGATGSPRDVVGSTFDSKIDRAFTVSTSPSDNTTTVTYVSTGEGKVDADLRSAANGMTDRIIRVDNVRVNAYSGFFYSAAWIVTRVRLKGHVGYRIPGTQEHSTPPSTTAAPRANNAAVQTPPLNTNGVVDPWSR
ncbi:hypothetical protein [Paraliomyxa miuraensis]|uniref:hypothetical protein n=1 Tax=Paraliomyxa miuraensis TaxID=376150 RepID=UPI002258969A|nr:hypothetical protein [Paraliomyxa miuraensis]MCX4239422.1 hypothetical protein [Paraliomyxa miuraensis]